MYVYEIWEIEGSIKPVGKKMNLKQMREVVGGYTEAIAIEFEDGTQRLLVMDKDAEVTLKPINKAALARLPAFEFRGDVLIASERAPAGKA
jgi:hypothetical protein